MRDYAGLATALAEQISRTSADPAGDALAAGQAWGRSLVDGRAGRHRRTGTSPGGRPLRPARLCTRDPPAQHDRTAAALPASQRRPGQPRRRVQRAPRDRAGGPGGAGRRPGDEQPGGVRRTRGVPSRPGTTFAEGTEHDREDVPPMSSKDASGSSENRRGSAGLDDPLTEALVRTRRFFTKGRSPTTCARCTSAGGRQADDFYRDRWSHDKVVRSTHGVNCTGSCSWKVYVKDGIITWETAADRLPLGRARTARSTSPAAAPAAPRSPGTPTRRPGSATPTSAACCCRCTARPRPSTTATRCAPGRTSSRTPSARGATSRRAARAAWCAPPGTRRREIVAAAHVHTIKKYGPDRVAGFSPIPAMSMVSHASGARFVNLIGGSMLCFYDWYADLPVASPQVFGDQTDVPESGDWWNAGYLIMWGSNLPVTRTPDAHWMTEARYRGQKVDRGRARLRRQREVRRRVAAAAAGHRRRAGDGDGPRHAQGVLRRPADAVLHRLRQEVHRPAVPGPPRRGGDGTVHRRASSSPPPTSPDARRTPRTPTFKTVLHRRAHRRAGRARTARSATGSATQGVGQVEPRPRRRRPAALAARRRRRRRSLVAAAALRHPGRRGRATCRAACRSAASAATWSPRSST